MDVDFSRLEQLAAKLNQSSESLNEAIRLVETKFAQLRLGVEASVELERSPVLSGGTPIGEVVSYFAYVKRTGKWGLYFIDIEDSGEELSCEPFSQASREYRLKAINKVPELVKRLEQKAEELLKEIRSSQQTVESILEKQA
ncbi:MAG TPA: hypothetical protein VK598_02695 [Nitrospiraceae bacterium]|nr:hypothetical protein [Nitrospiraceae bacterium]